MYELKSHHGTACERAKRLRCAFVGLAVAAVAGCGGSQDQPSNVGTVQSGLSVASTGSGPWSAAATWVGGHVPVAGDDVTISAGHTVTYDDTTPDELHTLTVHGTLTFASSSNLELDTNHNVVVDGTLVMRPDATHKHTLKFVKVDESLFTGGGTTPIDNDVGLWITGAGVLDAVGTPKTSWTRLVSYSNPSGSVPGQLVVDDATGWKVGDTVVITPTEAATDTVGTNQYAGYDSVTISAVSGNTVNFTQTLSRPHPTVNGQWRPEVLNLTRNVLITGTPPDNICSAGVCSHRAHVMFSQITAQQKLNNVEIAYMGPRKQINDNGQIYTQGVLGRYGLHFHMSVATGHVVDGLALHDIGSHAFVPHMSDGVTIKNSVSHGTWDEAYWYDPGDTNATNNILWDHDVASLVLTDPPFRGFRLAGFVLGAGQGNTLTNSVAVGVQGNTNAAGFEWPENTISSPWTFHDNIAHNNKIDGIFTWQNGCQSHQIDNYIAYRNGSSGIEHGAYGNRYTYQGLTLYGNKMAGFYVHAVSCPDTVSPQTVENVVVDGEGITGAGFLVAAHTIEVGSWAPTVVKNATVRNLASGGKAAKWWYADLAQGPGDPGYDPNGAMISPELTTFLAHSNHREWFKFVNADFSALDPSAAFGLTGATDSSGSHGVLPESDIHVTTPLGAAYTLHSLFFTPTFNDNFTPDGFTDPIPTPSAWRWYWAPQHVSGAFSAPTLANGEGVFTGAAVGSDLFYITTRLARDVVQTTTVRVNDAGSWAGLFARRADAEDRETYYKVDVGDASSGHPLTIYKVSDGVTATLAASSSVLADNVNYRLELALAGSNLQARLWAASGSRPTNPTVQFTDPDPLLAARPGRFGVVARTDASGTAVFDDYASNITDALTLQSSWNGYVQSWAASGTPIVAAGPNQSTLLPTASINIDATVTYNGTVNPTTGLTYSWAKVSGPGTVTFTSPNAIDTGATFSSTGQYVLRLSASNGTLVGTDDVHVVVNAAQSALSVSEDWNLADFSAWPAQWTVEHTATDSVYVQTNQGKMSYSGYGRTLAYINDHNAEAVELVSNISLSANNARGGLFARKLDADGDTYLGALIGQTGFAVDNLRIFMVVDGVQSDIVTLPSPVASQTPQTFWMKFRVESNVDGTMNLRVKIWNTANEPSTWTLQQLAWKNTIFEGRSGRFGVIGEASQGNRSTAFDHFGATAAISDVPIPNSGFDVDANGDSIPDGWTPGGIGTFSLVSSPVGGTAAKLDVTGGNNAYMDSSVGVLAAAPPSNANLVITISALTSGSLNLADVELNAYSTTNGTGTPVAGYTLNVLGQPGNFATFTTTQPIPTTARSIRARIRARGAGSVTFDNLRLSVQN